MARRSHRCEAPVLPRITSFPPRCVGSVVALGVNWQFFLERPDGLRYEDRAVHPNNGFFMCSTADSTTPKTDMSHMTHTLLNSLAARRPASSNESAAAQVGRHNHSACIKVRIRSCLTAHPPKHTHGASCVEPNVSLFIELQWLTRVSSALPCLAPLLRAAYSGALPIVNVTSLVATNRSQTVTYHFLIGKPKHTTFEAPRDNGNSHSPPLRAFTLGGFPLVCLVSFRFNLKSMPSLSLQTTQAVTLVPFPPPARQRKVPKSEMAAQVYTCEGIDTWVPLDTMSRQWDEHRSTAFFVAELADRGRERNSSPRRHAMASLVTSARDTRCRNLFPSLYLVWQGCGHARAQCIFLTVGSARPQRMFFTNRTQIVS